MHHWATEGTRSWGLPFPFLITYMLRKKGIKGTSTDGPITEHPQFSRIQWNQSYSHMPWEHWARAIDEPEPMDMDEVAATEEEADPEESITIRAPYFYALQESLAGIRFELANMQRNACQDKLEANERYKPCCEPSQQGCHQHREHLRQHRSDVSSTLTPCITLFYFMYPHIVDIVQFKFGGVYTFCSLLCSLF